MISLLNFVVIAFLASGTTTEFCKREAWDHSGIGLKLPKHRAALPIAIVAPDFPSTTDYAEPVVIHITFNIQNTGRLSSVALRDGTLPSNPFTEASINTAKKWIFLPERKNCNEVETIGVYAQIRFFEGQSEVFLDDA